MFLNDFECFLKGIIILRVSLKLLKEISATSWHNFIFMPFQWNQI